MAPHEESNSSQQRFASFGTGLLLLALVAVVTGIVLLPFYSPTAERAHASVTAIQASPVLRIVRGAHHWGSALLLALGGLFLLQGVFTGAYRRPAHWAWIGAVGLVLTGFIAQLTGHLLPWDAHAVSTTVIEVGVAENAPVVGKLQAQMIRGGDAVSPKTLTLWYGAHIGLVPVALVAVSALTLPYWRRVRRAEIVPRLPMAIVLLVLVALAVALPPSLGRAATPDDYSSFAARSEWYVLPLHGLLRLAQAIRPELAFVGTMVVPGLAVLALLALPWLDRQAHGKSISPPICGIAGLAVIMTIVLGGMNREHMAPIFGPKESAAAAPGGGNANIKLDPALVAKGKDLYGQNGCAGCHKVAGQGGAAGPPLDNAGKNRPDLDWQIRHLKNPASANPGSTMPPYDRLSDDDLKALATYLLSLK